MATVREWLCRHCRASLHASVCEIQPAVNWNCTVCKYWPDSKYCEVDAVALDIERALSDERKNEASYIESLGDEADDR